MPRSGAGDPPVVLHADEQPRRAGVGTVREAHHRLDEVPVGEGLPGLLLELDGHGFAGADDLSETLGVTGASRRLSGWKGASRSGGRHNGAIFYDHGHISYDRSHNSAPWRERRRAAAAGSGRRQISAARREAVRRERAAKVRVPLLQPEETMVRGASDPEVFVVVGRGPSRPPRWRRDRRPCGSPRRGGRKSEANRMSSISPPPARGCGGSAPRSSVRCSRAVSADTGSSAKSMRGSGSPQGFRRDGSRVSALSRAGITS